jgi:hypothetical protein
MTLPSSGAISTQQIAAEIGVSTVTIPDTNTRTLTGISSGAITLPNSFWGKSWSDGGTVTVTMSPGAQSLSGTTTSKTFSAESISVSGGTPSSYSWSAVSQSGGTFSASGSSSSCTPSVSGVSAGTTATATLRCVVNVGGTNYTKNASISYQNTSTPPPPTITFTPASGTFLSDSGVDGGSVGVSASGDVNWSKVGSGILIAPGTSASISYTTDRYDSNGDGVINFNDDYASGSATGTLTAKDDSGNVLGTWDYQITATGGGGGGA